MSLFPDKLSSEQLQQYLSGEMTDAQQHWIEKYLLENPPETQALAGLSQVENKTELANDLNELKKRIRARVQEDEKIPVKPLIAWRYNPMNIAVAACVTVLLAAVTILFVLNFYKQQPPQVAHTPHTVQTPANTLPPTTPESHTETAERPANPETATPNTFRKYDSESPAKIVENKKIPTQSDSQPIEKPALPKTEITEAPLAVKPQLEKQEPVKEEAAYGLSEQKKTEMPVVSKDKADLQKSAPVATERQRKESRSKKKAISGKPDILRLTGTVTDEAGNPLPGVNISVKGSREGVVTDSDGNYRMEIAENTTMVFSFIGYTTFEGVIKDVSQPLSVKLSPDIQALNEVVVVAYGSDENKDETERFFITEPVSGYPKYKQYVKDNLQYPPVALENKVEGNVIISFVVNPDQQLSDFKIRRRLGYGCEEEALRLIKNGPAWNPALRDGIPVPQRIRMKIRFKIK